MSYQQPYHASSPSAVDRLAFAGVRNSHLAKAGLLTLIFPLVAFALQLQPVAAVLLILAAMLASYLVCVGWRPGRILSAQLDLRLYAACLAGSVVLCLLGGEYHVFFSTFDWLIRDAVLADLVLNKFPVFYHALGVDTVLRAPLAMYMLPSIVGWLLGLEAAHFALLVQNSFLFSIIFYTLLLLVEGAKLRFVALFLLFGPLDVIPQISQSLVVYLRGGEFIIDPHFMMWNTLVWFWSQLPQIFWAPNHTISGWTIALLILLNVRREIDIVVLGVSSIILLFWSPLGLIGALPLLIWRGLASLSTLKLTSRRTVAAALSLFCFAPLFMYLGLDAGALSRGWLFNEPNFVFWYAAAMIFSLPQAWIVLSARDFVAPWLKPTLYIAIAILVLMPLYRIGATSTDHDMSMRCMLAPMFILAFAFCEAAPTLVELPGRRALLTMIVIMLSSMTALMEIRRAISDQAYAINDCNLLTVTEKALPGFPSTNYLARVDRAPEWLLRREGRRLEIEQRQCWPGYALMKGA